MGLQPKVQNLVILAFAAQADRTLVRNGAPAQASLDRIDDAVELREEPLPDEADLGEGARARRRTVRSGAGRGAEGRDGVEPGRGPEGEGGREARTHLADLLRDLRPRVEKFWDSADGAAPDDDPLGPGASRRPRRRGQIRSRPSRPSPTQRWRPARPRCRPAARGASTICARPCLGRVLGHHRDRDGLSDHRRGAAEGLREKLAEALEADEHVVQR